MSSSLHISLPTSPSTTPCSFPRFRCHSYFVNLSDYSPSFSLLSPWYLSLFLYPLYEWNHMMIILLHLTKFTQHNTLWFHQCWSQSCVSILSNGWAIFHCIHRPHLLYPLIFQCAQMLLPQFGYCGHCCYKHWNASVLSFYCTCIFGVNPQQCNFGVIGQLYF